MIKQLQEKKEALLRIYIKQGSKRLRQHLLDTKTKMPPWQQVKGELYVINFFFEKNGEYISINAQVET